MIAMARALQVVRRGRIAKLSKNLLAKVNDPKSPLSTWPAAALKALGTE